MNSKKQQQHSQTAFVTSLTTRFALSVKLDFMACISEFKIDYAWYLVSIPTVDILAVDMRLNASL